MQREINPDHAPLKTSNTQNPASHNPPPPPYMPLSPTEKRVFELLIQRLTERQVADQLDRSPNTIHVHVRNIYRKLGIRTRQQLLDHANPTPGNNA